MKHVRNKYVIIFSYARMEEEIEEKETNSKMGRDT